MDLGDRSGHVPRQAEVEGERWCDAPVILDEGPVNLPAPSGDCTAVCLVVDCPSRQTQQQIGLGIAAEESFVADQPESVLKSLRAHIHLVIAKIDAGANLVVAANQVHDVLEGVDVRSALERGVAAITERPIAAIDLSGNQALAV